MSLSFPNLVLPNCVGWSYDVESRFSTIAQRPKSQGHVASATLQQSVVYGLDLTYEFLGNTGITYADDMTYVQAFYEACKGGFGWFTWDPSVLGSAAGKLYNMSVAHVPAAPPFPLRNGFFAIGDGATKTFPLWRSTSVFGSGTLQTLELIQNVTLLAGVYSNGTLVSPAGYSQTNFPAQITFTAAPAAGVVLSWEGNYSYLCRFAEDTLGLSEFMYQLWELKALKLETVLL
jgi:hypothetical protein